MQTEMEETPEHAQNVEWQQNRIATLERQYEPPGEHLIDNLVKISLKTFKTDSGSEEGETAVAHPQGQEITVSNFLRVQMQITDRKRRAQLTFQAVGGDVQLAFMVSEPDPSSWMCGRNREIISDYGTHVLQIFISIGADADELGFHGGYHQDRDNLPLLVLRYTAARVELGCASENVTIEEWNPVTFRADEDAAIEASALGAPNN